MEAIVAVYEDWGIGYHGVQPVALSDDRQFFREMTQGAALIMGRRTMEALQKPLPGRANVVLSHTGALPSGFLWADSVEKALDITVNQRVFVIGGGSVYRQLLPLCQRVYVTKLRLSVESDTFFPNLDADPQWVMAEILQSGVENGIAYEICRYESI